MKVLVRIGAVLLVVASFGVPITASAGSPNAGGTVLRSQTSQLSGHFQTVDSTGCVINDLFIHAVLEDRAIDASVQSFDSCTNTLLLLAGGTAFNADVQVDPALQNGRTAGTVLTFDRLTGNTVPVAVDLRWIGTGGLNTAPFAPGLSPNTIGFHWSDPWVSLTFTGVLSTRAATMAGSAGVRGFTFPSSSAQSDFTVLSSGRSEFILTFKP